MGGWSTAQRAVVIVGWAGLLRAIWIWVQNDGPQFTFGDNDGWYNYAPNTGAVFSGGGPPFWITNPTVTMLTEMAFVVLWLATSFWLLGVRPVAEDGATSSGSPEDSTS